MEISILGLLIIALVIIPLAFILGKRFYSRYIKGISTHNISGRRKDGKVEEVTGYTADVWDDMSANQDEADSNGHTYSSAGTLTVFLSYRRDDSADVSGRIYDGLCSKLGEKNIFKDVDSMVLGVDVREAISNAVSQAQILLVVIGPDWLGEEPGGGRRIDEARDYVRLEVEVALDQGKPVIPLFVRNATIPDEKDLPASITKLAFQNGMPVRSDPDFHHDMSRLLSGLSRLS